jgi:hypothetical protein
MLVAPRKSMDITQMNQGLFPGLVNQDSGKLSKKKRQRKNRPRKRSQHFASYNTVANPTPEKNYSSQVDLARYSKSPVPLRKSN